MFCKQRMVSLWIAALIFCPSISTSSSQNKYLVAFCQQSTLEQKQQNSTQSFPDLIPLELDKGIEKELTGGETQSYLLKVDKGQYIELVVEQKGIDVVVAVYDSNNQKVYELDSPNGTTGPEPVYLVTTANGDYRLDVRSDDKKAKVGKYEVKIKEIRVAGNNDKTKVAAYKSYGEAELLRVEGKPESIKNAIVKYEEAISLFNSIGDGREEADSCNTLGRLYQALGDYAKAENYLQRSLIVKEQALGTDHPDLAFFYNTLGVLYRVKGEYEKAENCYKQAIIIREKALGAEHLNLAAFYNNLGFLYLSKGELSKAEPLLQKALAIYEKNLGTENLEVANSCNNLGSLYQTKGELSKAEPLFQKALAIYEKVLGENHLLAARVCNNLGLLCQTKGEFEKAEKLLQRALTVREQILGTDHPDVAVSYNNLGDFYRTKEEYVKAEPLLQRALVIGEKSLGANHPNKAITFSNVGLLYQAKGEYEKAEALYKQALAISEKALGLAHPNVATLNNNLGFLYSEKGEYEKAEVFYKHALELREKTLGLEHPDIAQSYNNLGSVYQAKGEYDKAELFYEKALDIRQKSLGLEHFNVGSSLYNLGTLYQAKGEYDKAELFYEKALKIREKVLGTDRPDILISNNLGLLYQVKGEYKRAKLLYEGKIAIIEKVLGINHPLVATFCNNLASLHKAKGEYDKAEALYKRALEIREKAFGLYHPDVGTDYNNLGIFYESKGEYEKAEFLLEKGLSIREKVLGLYHPNVAQTLNNLGALRQSKGEYDKAEALYKRALEIREKAFGLYHPDVASTYNNLGSLYTKKDYEKAEFLLKQALIIKEKTVGINHPEVATCYNNLGLFYQSKKDYKNAEEAMQKALTIVEKALGENHIYVARSFNNLGELYKVKGDYEKAEQLLQKALIIIEKTMGENHPNTATLANNLARFYLLKGDIEKAIIYINKANEYRETEFSHNLIGGTENQKLLYLKQTAFEQDLTISLNVQNAPTNFTATQAAASTILRRKGRTLDAIVNNIELLRNQLDVEDQNLLEELTNKYTYLSKITLDGPNKESNEVYQAKLKDLNEQVEKLETEICSHSAKFRSQKFPITLENIQKAIPENAVLVEFSTYRPYDAKNDKYGEISYVVYVLTHEGKISFANLGNLTTIEEAVKEFRQTLIREPGSPLSSISKTLKPKAQNIHKLILEPIREFLGGKTHLLISPDGVLNTIPFEAFVDESGKYLVETYEISYLTSGRDLLRLQTKIPSKEPATIIGAPNYGNGPGATLLGQQYPVQALFASIQEVNNIKNILPKSKVYVREEATKEVVKNVNYPEILHIATHGYYLSNIPKIETQGSNTQDTLSVFETSSITPKTNIEELRKINPLLRCWLFFAGANNNSTDGIMTGLEVSRLNLFGTKLVVLSACNSGLGEIKNNEGVYGLRRALVLAGAETQMTSLWEVNDDATKDLLVNYYKLLKSGESRSKALRQIQLSLLYKTPLKLQKTRSSLDRKKRLDVENVNNDYSHPYFWASFVLSGEWRALEEK
ncbi:MAG: tetratricopeptide repeat protein [Blastocatellia bacterium]